MIVECVFLSLTLCNAIRQKPVVALSAAHASLMFVDGRITRMAVEAGGKEDDPIERVFIGARPAWPRMILAGTGQIMLETWLSDKLKNSRHSWERRLWWTPQAVGISLTVSGIAYSYSHRGVK